MGFRLPVDKWFRGDLGIYGESILLKKGSFVQTIFKKEKIRYILSEHKKHEQLGYGRHLWALLMLELWYTNYFAGVK